MAAGGDDVGLNTSWMPPTNAFLICVILVINSNKSWKTNAFLKRKIVFSSTYTINVKAYFYEGKKNLTD